MITSDKITDGILFVLGHLNDLVKNEFITMSHPNFVLTDKGYASYLNLKAEGFTLDNVELAQLMHFLGAK